MYIQLQNIEGQNRTVWNGNFDEIYGLYVAQHDENDYHLLSGIDPHDDTIFNSLQVPRLIPELEHLQSVAGDATTTESDIEQLILFLKAVRIGVFMRVVGD